MNNVRVVAAAIAFTLLILVALPSSPSSPSSVSTVPQLTRRYLGASEPASSAVTVHLPNNVTYTYHLPSSSSASISSSSSVSSSIRGLALLFHSCRHTSFNFFRSSPRCPSCHPLPEELRITRALLSSNYAVLAPLSSSSSCWHPYNIPIGHDYYIVSSSISHFFSLFPLIPSSSSTTVAVGVSSGARFASSITANVSAVLCIVAPSTALSSASVNELQRNKYQRLIPHVFVHMGERDRRTASQVADNVVALRNHGVHVRALSAVPKPVGDAAFWRDAFGHEWGWSEQQVEEAARMMRECEESTVVDSKGYLKENPKRSEQWRKCMKRWAQTHFQDDLNDRTSAIAEQMNRAYGLHEATADYIQEALDLFEDVASNTPTRR